MELFEGNGDVYQALSNLSRRVDDLESKFDRLEQLVLAQTQDLRAVAEVVQEILGRLDEEAM